MEEVLNGRLEYVRKLCSLLSALNNRLYRGGGIGWIRPRDRQARDPCLCGG